MKLLITRSYHDEGTNGTLFIDGETIPFCFTIELPWLDNQPRRSCIPEGVYLIEKRFSKKLKSHLHIINVPGREWILIHPANDAMAELKGCIAPVTQITGIGKGTLSQKAFFSLIKKVDSAFLKNEPIYLTINSGPKAGVD